MAFIELPENPEKPENPDHAEGERAALGYVPNYSRVFAHRPAAYAAWGQLNRAIKQSMDLRRYELATLAAALELGSSYCSLAHGKALLDRFVDAPSLRAIALDHSAAGLSDVDVAVMDLAQKVARDAGSVTQADVARLRALGVVDDEIVDVVLTAAARCFFSKTLDALGVEPDSAYRELDPALRDLLTVGRPIAGVADVEAP